MTTVKLPNATDAASFESDLDAVTNGAENTDYVIPITQNVTIATTDADINPTTQTQNVVIPTGSTLTLDGPGTLTITSPDQLVFAGTLTSDTPINGEVSVYSGVFVNDAVTPGSTPAGGIINGSVASNQDGVSVQNSGQITGTGPAAVYVGDGLVVNASGGLITDAVTGAYTVEFTAGPGTVLNAGTISATGGGGFGAVFSDGGTLTNGGFSGETTPAILQGGLDGAIFIGAAGTLTNDGSISSTGGDGAQFYEVAGTVTNGSSTDSAATIIASGATGAGVSAASGTVTNSATIQGGAEGVQFLGDSAGDTGTVVNTGTISATDATGGAGSGAAIVGVALLDGGTVTNGAAGGTVASSASISGADVGVYVLSGTSTVTNSGTISGTYGVDFEGNMGDAVGTVVDSGAITSTGGATGVAILFGTGAERLVLDPGYAITGEVVGGSFTNTDTTALELGGGTSGTFTGLAAGSGTLANSASGFTFKNIQTIDIDSSASWAFSGSNAIATLRVDGTATVAGTLDVTTALDPAGTGGVVTVASGGLLELAAATGSGDTIDLAGTAELKIDTAASFGTTTGTTYTGDVIGQFALSSTTVPGSTIDLGNVAFSSATDTFNTSRNVLTVTDGTNTANISFVAGLFATSDKFVLTTDGSGGTLISVACYCPGTRIATPDGQVAIETLAIGDLVLTADGRAEPIRWIGRRSYAGRFLAANPKVHPIRFRKGSLGKGLPRRDLVVSPQHAMFIEGMLIPARCLVNGSSIAIDHDRDLVEYIHLELANHDVILAEGAASETFMDDDSRAMFQNAAEYAAMYPDAPEPSGFYAARLESGYEVEAIRAKLANMAERAAKRRAGKKLSKAA